MPRELLVSITKKDLDISYFSGTGAGGQYRNKHQNCVRITHRDSGVTVTGQSNRERLANTKEAFENLLANPKFKLWHNIKIREAIDKISWEQKIENSLTDENLKWEVKDEKGRWVEDD